MFLSKIARSGPLAFTSEHGPVSSNVVPLTAVRDFDPDLCFGCDIALRDQLRSQVRPLDRDLPEKLRSQVLLSQFEPAGASLAEAIAYESGAARVIDDIAAEMDRHAREQVEGDSPAIAAERARLRRLAGLEG